MILISSFVASTVAVVDFVVAAVVDAIVLVVGVAMKFVPEVAAVDDDFVEHGIVAEAVDVGYC